MTGLPELEEFLSQFPEAAAEYPFGPEAQVWKVLGKMFALVSVDAEPLRISLKCDPDLALELRAQYPETVTGGYYLNKRHWNTVTLDDTIPGFEIEEWIGHSYDLVVAGLPKKVRAGIDDR